MAEVTLKAYKRESTGKGPARRARAQNKVPGVLYGQGLDPVAVEVDRRELVTAFLTDAGMNVLLSIELDGSKTTALAREIQRDPLRGTVLHADFVKVDLTQEVDVEVPLHLVGDAPGVKEGGVLEHPLSQLQVRCLPAEVPESVQADISAMNIGDTLRVADLPPSDTYQILSDPDAVVASIAAPISEEELAAMEAATLEPAAEAAEEAAAEEAAPDEEAPAEGAPEAPAGEEQAQQAQQAENT